MDSDSVAKERGQCAELQLQQFSSDGYLSSSICTNMRSAHSVNANLIFFSE